MRTMMIGMAALVAGLAAAAPADAQQAVDDRWLPWLGCWEPAGPEGPMTCFLPSGDADAVERVTFHGDDVRREVLHGNGQARPTSLEGCTGTEAIEFSSDTRRVYTQLDLECEGGETRSSRSLLAFVEPDAWIDVTSARIAGNEAAWVTTYQPASTARMQRAGVTDPAAGRAMAVESARYAAAGPIGVDAVIDAHAAVGPEAVRSWIARTGEPMQLDSERLIRLADAGVPPEVIDVAVAVSFPEEFEVSERPEDRVASAGRQRVAYGALWPYYGSYRYGDPFYYGYRSRYDRFGPYALGYGGYGYGFAGPTVIVVRPVDGSEPARGGRVISGRGYSSGSGNGTAAMPRVRPRTGTSDAGVRSSGSSESSSSTGRKAKPRGEDN